MAYWPISVKFNDAGTAAPTASNNLSQGYQGGSWWLNTTADPPDYYICLFADQGTAVWMLICQCGSVGPPTPPGDVGGQHSSYLGNPVGATFGRP